MPVRADATIEITAFRWVPEFAQGVVRDLRARWALEEAGLDYKVELLGQDKPPQYVKEQPFEQVPVLRDGDVRIFESGAIVQYIGEKSGTLLTTVLRQAGRGGLLDRSPTLAAYVERAESRPAFKRALADHLEPFAANQPQGVAA